MMKKTALLCSALIAGAGIFAVAQLTQGNKAAVGNLRPAGEPEQVSIELSGKSVRMPARIQMEQDIIDVYENVELLEMGGNSGTWSYADDRKSCTISVPSGGEARYLFIPVELNFARGETIFSFDVKAEGICKVSPAANFLEKSSNKVSYLPLDEYLLNNNEEKQRISASCDKVWGEKLPTEEYYHGFWIMVSADTDVNLYVTDISMVQVQNRVPSAVTDCPVTMENTDAYLQVGENDWLGFRIPDESYALLSGIYTESTELTLPNFIRFPEVYGDAEIPVTGMNSQRLDWSLCPNLQTLVLSDNGNPFTLGSFTGSSVTDIYVQCIQCYQWSTDSYLRTDGVVTNVHIRLGSRHYFTGEYWSGCEILVGDEVPGMPSMPNSEYRAKVDDNGYVGVYARNGRLSVAEICTDAESFVIPEALPWGIVSNLYYVGTVGRDDEAGDVLCAQAPNLISLTIPSDIFDLYINFSATNIKELHFAGGAPYSSAWDIPTDIVIYVQNKEYYDDFCNKFPLNKVIPEGWEFEWLTVNVAKPGEFAQTYLELTDNNWEAGEYVKVTGKLHNMDLTNMRMMSRLKRLDLSEAEFTELPQNFMKNRDNLQEVILPSTTLTIGSEAFYYCKNLSAVRVAGENNLKAIGSEAFYYCYKLVEFDASTVEVIDPNAFCLCSSLDLTSVASAKTIGTGAFQHTGIREIHPEFFNPEIKELTGALFYGCESLTSVELPESIERIGNAAFRDCPALTSIKLPSNVNTIEGYAFSGTALESIEFSDRLRVIGNYALDDCYNLTEVKCHAVAPPMADYFITNANFTNLKLYVPSISLDSYRETEGWNRFFKMYSLNEPVDYIYVDRYVNIDLNEEDNELMANSPHMVLSDYRMNYGTSVGQLQIEGEGTLSTSVFDIYPKLLPRDWGQSDNYTIPSLINNADKMRTDSLCVHMEIYPDYWHFITLPYDVQVRDIVPGPETYWVIRSYDSAKRAQGGSGNNWIDLTEDDVMEAGKGYIVRGYTGTYNYNPSLTFPSRNTITKNNIFRSNDIQVALEEHVAEFAHNRSWNLVGNPYGAYVYTPWLMDQNGEQLTTPITLWRGDSYQAYSPADDDLILRPYESFFIQRPLNSEYIVFPAESRYHYNAVRNFQNGPGMFAPANIERPTTAGSDREVFDFTLTSTANDKDNRARVVLNENATAGYDLDRDAVKFFTVENNNPLIYVSADQSYEICERPFGNGEATLGIQLKNEADYTISLSGRHTDGWKVWLTDTYTGTTVELTATAYSFSGEQSADSGRFLIRFEKPATSAVEGFESFDPQAEVTISTVEGINIYTGAIGEFSAPSAGIYIVTTAGKSVKVMIKD